LLAAGHRVVLVCVGEVEPPPLPGLVVHTLPENLLGTVPGHRYVHTVDLGVPAP